MYISKTIKKILNTKIYMPAIENKNHSTWVVKTHPILVLGLILLPREIDPLIYPKDGWFCVEDVL